MNDKDRFQKLLTASPEVLEKVDSVLEGRAQPLSENINLMTLTLLEAAKRIGVSRPTIYRLVKRGELETVLIGGLERVRLESLINLATKKSSKSALQA